MLVPEPWEGGDIDIPFTAGHSTVAHSQYLDWNVQSPVNTQKEASLSRAISSAKLSMQVFRRQFDGHIMPLTANLDIIFISYIYAE